MTDFEIPCPTITIGGDPLPLARTRGSYLGGYDLTLSTVFPDMGFSVESTFLGVRGTGTATAHVVRLPNRSSTVRQELLAGDAIETGPGRGRCLLEHYRELQYELAQLSGEVVVVEVGDDSLAAVARS